MEENSIQIKIAETKFSPIKFGIISIILVMLFYQFAGMVIYYFISLVGPSSTFNLRISALAGQLLFMLLPTLFLLKWQHGSILNGLPLRIPKLSEMLTTILIIILLQFVLEGFIYFQMKLPFPQFVKEVLDQLDQLFELVYRQLIIANSVAELSFVLLVVAIVPGICEEVLFRGLFMKNLLIVKTPLSSIAISGIIFALIHFNPIALIPLIVLGMYLGFLVYRTQSIFIPIIAHITNNAFSTIKVFFNPDLIKQDSTTLSLATESEINLIIVMVVVSIIIYFLHKYFKQITESIQEKIV